MSAVASTETVATRIDWVCPWDGTVVAYTSADEQVDLSKVKVRCANHRCRGWIKLVPRPSAGL